MWERDLFYSVGRVEEHQAIFALDLRGRNSESTKYSLLFESGINYIITIRYRHSQKQLLLAGHSDEPDQQLFFHLIENVELNSTNLLQLKKSQNWQNYKPLKFNGNDSPFAGDFILETDLFLFCEF